MTDVRHHTISELQKISFDTAVAKGWWEDCTMDGEIRGFLVEQVLDEKLALIHSEVSEALEDYRVDKMMTTYEVGPGKPVGFPSELADIIIRVMDLAGAMEIDLELDVHCRLFTASTDFRPFTFDELQRAAFAAEVFEGSWLACRSETCRGYLDVDRTEVVQQIPSRIQRLHRIIAAMGGCDGCDLEQIVLSVMALAEALGIDLEKEICIKQDFNARRPMRHGGKRC